MRYKGGYEPSELLCPVTLRWAPLERCRPILDRRPYARLASLGDGEAEEGGMEGMGAVAGVAEPAVVAAEGEGEGDGEGMELEEEEEEEEADDDFDEDEDEEEEEDEEDGRYGLHVPITPAEASALEEVAMDVGPLAALPPRSQQILLPILREFVAHVTPALVPRLLIKLRH